MLVIFVSCQLIRFYSCPIFSSLLSWVATYTAVGKSESLLLLVCLKFVALMLVLICFYLGADAVRYLAEPI